ncbi:MAG: HNH endonuclease signature motif containing protein [Pseudomonadota bacterium]
MSNRRPAIPNAVKLALFAESAGYCQDPACLEPLYPSELGGNVHLAEMAHILPWGANGPRNGERTEDHDELNSVENLILLHPTCHTRIDKAPEQYPRQLLLEWKANHLSALNAKRGVVEYESRDMARRSIHPRMEENKVIWRRYAPEDGDCSSLDPESDAAEVWESRVKSVIIPNLYHILAVAELNRHLITRDETTVVAAYKEHVRGFAARHLTDSMEPVQRYPVAMEDLFT